MGGLEREVVDQAHPTHVRGERQQSRLAQLRHGFERVGIDEREVVGHDVGRVQRRARGVQQRLGRALAGGGPLHGGAERSVQRTRAHARGGVEQDVAAGERQPVGLAHGWAHRHAHRQIQIGHQTPDHHDLLGVLLAEVGHVGQAHAEQLGDDGGDAAEVLGPARGALQAIGEAQHLHLGGEPCG